MAKDTGLVTLFVRSHPRKVLDVVVGKAVQSKSPKKDAGAASRKKLYFVLHNRIESDDEAMANFASKTQNYQPLACE